MVKNSLKCYLRLFLKKVAIYRISCEEYQNKKKEYGIKNERK